jgi:hypothetical protein
MKKILLFLCLFWTNIGFSQDFALFKATIIFNDGTRQRGVLYDVTETELLLTPDAPNLKAILKSGNEPGLTHISLKDSTLRGIVLRRKGFVGRNLLGSMAILGGVGIVAGYLSGDDRKTEISFLPSWESKAFFGGLVGVFGSIYTTPIISLFPKRKVYKHQIKAGETDNILEKFSLRWQKENRIVEE